MGKKNIVIFLICFVCSTLLLTGLLAYNRKRIYPKDDNLQIVFIGDSNIAFDRDGVDIPMMVADNLGVTTYNCALGGTLASRIDYNNEYDFYYDQCCLYNLANLIVTGDKTGFEDDMQAMVEAYELSNIRVKLISILDFNKIDYLFISYGMNDYKMGVPIENPENPYDCETYVGAIRCSLDKIIDKYPNIKIVLTPPNFAYTEDNGKIISGREKDFGGGTLEDYRNALSSLATNYDNVYFLDTLNLMQIDETNCKKKMQDYEHLNKEGQAEWAKIACDLISQLENSK